MPKWLRVLCGGVCVLCVGIALLCPEWLYAKANRDYVREWVSNPKPVWTGMLTVGIVGDVQTGRGALVKWASTCADAFQKKNFGVYIDAVRLSAEQLYQMPEEKRPQILLFASGALSTPEGALLPLSATAGLDDAGRLSAAVWQGQAYGLPVAYGGYAACLNDPLSMKQDLPSPPEEGLLELSMLQSWEDAGISISDDGARQALYEQYRDELLPALREGGAEAFMEGQAVCLVCDEAQMLSLVAATREGKCPAFSTWLASTWTDRVWYGGVGAQVTGEQKQVCEDFLCFLRADESATQALVQCGFFAPCASEWQYAGEAALGGVEVGLPARLSSPEAFGAR